MNSNRLMSRTLELLNWRTTKMNTDKKASPKARAWRSPLGMTRTERARQRGKLIQRLETSAAKVGAAVDRMLAEVAASNKRIDAMEQRHKGAKK